MMTVDLRIGERLVIGDTTILVCDKSGQRVRLSIEADKTVPIRRPTSDSGVGRVKTKSSRSS